VSRVPFVVFATICAAPLVNACGDDGGNSDPALFPANYAATYQEVRNCRYSLEHDSIRVRVLASPEALTPYTGRVEPFPAGAIVLKEQYDYGDMTCAGPIINFTVMKKLAVGSSAASLDWDWQEVDADLHSTNTDIKRCTQCHADCGKPPDGYDATCTVP